MSQGVVNLSVRSIDEQNTPFANPIVGKGNTTIIQTLVEGGTTLVGIGSTENGELGVINPNLVNETSLSVNNSLGFSSYEPNVSIITGGEDYFGFVYKNNGIVVEDEIYTWGKNDKYQLGRGGRDSSGNNIFQRSSAPGRVDINGVSFTGTSRIRTYQAGWTHAHVITRDNRIFSWGNNYYGQLGISDGISGSLIDPSNFGIEPQEVTLSLSGETPYAVYGGKDYSAVLTLSGNVYAYGINDRYQLGISDGGITDFCHNPVHIPIDNVIQVATGESFVSVLRNDGTVWGWGDDTYGQISLLSTDVSGRFVDVPTRITDIDNAVYISAGNNHLCILRQDGTLSIVGDNRYQQSSLPTPNRNIVLGFANANNTYYVEVDGDLYGYGAGIDNSSGLIGNSQNTVGPTDAIKFFSSLVNNTTTINVDIRTVYNSLIVLEYNLIPEDTSREFVKFDEDHTLASSEYMEQKKAICFVRDIERKTNSTATSAELCCSSGDNSKPVVRFRSLKEQLQYEKGLFILDKKCLIRN